MRLFLFLFLFFIFFCDCENHLNQFFFVVVGRTSRGDKRDEKRAGSLQEQEEHHQGRTEREPGTYVYVGTKVGRSIDRSIDPQQVVDHDLICVCTY